MGKIIPASDCALLVWFGEAFSQDTHLQVRALVQALQRKPKLVLREIQPTYTSVLLRFDPLKISAAALTRALRPILKQIEGAKAAKPLPTRQVEIPVCYETPLAPDLQDVARATGLSAEEAIRRHTSAEYTVCFFGFMPGFSYWTGLPDRLAVPRLPSPRLKVPAGSVAIGGSQTGIYPLETPGGWRIIGRTPLKMFDPAAKRLCYLRLGDHIRLNRISLNEFKQAGGTWED